MGHRSGGAGAAGRCGHLCEGRAGVQRGVPPAADLEKAGAGCSGAVQPDAPALAISGEVQKVEAGSGKAHEVEKVEAGSGEEEAEQKVSAYHFYFVVFRL